MSEETPAKRGRKPSPLTGAIRKFEADKRRVEALNNHVVKWQDKLDGAKGDLENAIVELSNSRKNLDSVLGDAV